MSVAAKFSWLAQPLTTETKKEKYPQTLSQHAERHLYGHAAIRTGWCVGIVGAVCFLVSTYGWIQILANWPTPEPRFNVVDSTSGYVGPATTATDAPKTFGEATDHEYLRRYIEACEGWVLADDRSNDYLCKLMSTSTRQEQYKAWRKLATSPMTAIGKDGQVQMRNYRWHPLCGTANTEKCSPKGNLKRYLIQYDRVISGGKGIPGAHSWSATVDFEYHPELPMKPSDQDLNTAGFQDIAFSAAPDS